MPGDAGLWIPDQDNRFANAMRYKTTAERTFSLPNKPAPASYRKSLGKNGSSSSNSKSPPATPNPPGIWSANTALWGRMASCAPIANRRFFSEPSN
jgi:hypothetical protein